MKRLILVLAVLAGCGDDGGDDPGTDAAACAALTYDAFGEDFLSTYCAGCHGGNVSARMGAPANVVFDTLEQVKARKADLKEQVVVMKTMPFGPNSPKPSDADRAKFGAWLDCGPD